MSRTTTPPFPYYGAREKNGGGALGAYAKLYFRPGAGETIHTVVTPLQDDSCGICGRVERAGAAVSNALVLLFEAEGERTDRPIGAFVTDEEGEFAFGPLRDGKLYVVKVYKDSLKLRELEISI